MAGHSSIEDRNWISFGVSIVYSLFRRTMFRLVAALSCRLSEVTQGGYLIYLPQGPGAADRCGLVMFSTAIGELAHPFRGFRH